MGISYKKIISDNSFIYAASIICFLILCTIVFLFPVEFSGYKNSDMLAPFWNLVTLTGGVIGSSIIFLAISAYLFYHHKKFPNQNSRWYLFLTVIILLQIILSLVVKNFAKDFFKSPRPSHKYLIEKGIISNEGNEFYNLSVDERREFLKRNLDSGKNKLAEVYPPILESWINNAEFSFPSGHAFTGFYLGVIMAYIISITSGSRKNYFSIIPLIWGILVAVSRVAIGVHYPEDVAAGAFAGMLAGFGVIFFKDLSQT